MQHQAESIPRSAPEQTTGGANREAACCRSAVPGAWLDARLLCPATRARRRRVRLSRRVLLGSSATLIILCTFATLFVLSDVLRQRFAPGMATWLRHALLTVQAGVVTAVATGIVYLLMRRSQHRLQTTAESVSHLLASYKRETNGRERFENPHLVHCRTLADCDRIDCPMYDSPRERCWQVMALGRSLRNGQAPAASLDRCYGCAVFQTSCPDELTRLGEAFNNLMFLLEEEGRQLGRMQAQLVEKEKMVAIGQMATGVAHEVSNPLSSISSIVQMLKRRHTGSLPVEQLDLIETHIQRISGTVRQLVSLARPRPDAWELVDVGATLSDAVQLVRFDRRARNVTIGFQPPAAPLATYALRGQLQQVFINLALNALDAMPEGGTLGVGARARPQEIVVTVSDTGCGIAPEAGRRIFEPFFTTKEPGRGTGLGLSVSYGIVQRHGGTIDFDSQVGQGTTFTVTLPVMTKPPDGAHAATNRTAGG